MNAPGPRGLALGRVLWRMRSDALGAFVDAFDTYGDVVRVRTPGQHSYALYRAEHVEHVLVGNQDNYPKGKEYDVFASALGEGLLTSRGERWQTQRRLIQPMFAKRHLEPLASQMTAAGTRLLEQWKSAHRDGAQIDVHKAMMGLTLDVVGRALFSSDLTGTATRTIDRVMARVLTEVVDASVSPLTWLASSLPGMNVDRALRLRPRRQRRMRARLAELEAIVAQMIESRRIGAVGGEDLLSLLLDARDEESGARMSDRQLRDEVVTFIMAGHETTAAALAWTWLLLSQNPDARRRLHTEVDEVLNGRVPVFADADRLVWTRAVVQEAMRIYPPLWNVLRRARDDDVIGGVRIPAGATVIVLIYMTHRDPTAWPDAERFDPGRFLPDQARARPRHAYLPFAAGRRVCVGNTFALTEATLLTAMIAQRHTLDLEAGVTVEPQALATLRPRGGLPMRLRRRQAGLPGT